MRNLHLLDALRDTSVEVAAYFGWTGDHGHGMFRVPSCIDRVILNVVASSGEGWDHVSVSRHNRCPNWPEMSQIKELFFKDSEVVMQLHVPSKDHINYHPYCLHLWRPQSEKIPVPPPDLVGPKTDQPRSVK